MAVGSNTSLVMAGWADRGPALMRALALSPPQSRPPVSPTFLSKSNSKRRSPENLEIQENHPKEHCHKYLCVHKLLWISCFP